MEAPQADATPKAKPKNTPKAKSVVKRPAVAKSVLKRQVGSEIRQCDGCHFTDGAEAAEGPGFDTGADGAEAAEGPGFDTGADGAEAAEGPGVDTEGAAGTYVPLIAWAG